MTGKTRRAAPKRLPDFTIRSTTIYLEARWEVRFWWRELVMVTDIVESELPGVTSGFHANLYEVELADGRLRHDILTWSVWSTGGRSAAEVANDAYADWLSKRVLSSEA